MKKAKRSALSPTLVGVVHLPPLGGSPRAYGSPNEALRRAMKQALSEAKILESEGFDALIIENFGDAPFYKEQVPALTVASMAIVAEKVRSSVKIPIGINVLRNDGFSAAAIAAVSGCDFVRVNVVSGVVASDQGFIEGKAADLTRHLADLKRQGSAISVWADVLVKHAKTISTDSVELAIEEAWQRALADVVILSGSTTGRPVDLKRLDSALVLKDRPKIFLGSGVTVENLPEYVGRVDGMIVGSALRKEGRAGALLDLKRVKSFCKCLKLLM